MPSKQYAAFLLPLAALALFALLPPASGFKEVGPNPVVDVSPYSTNVYHPITIGCASQKIGWAAGRYWIFYGSSDNLMCATSSDGVSWSTSFVDKLKILTYTTYQSEDYAPFSVAFDNENRVHLVYVGSDGRRYYRRGTCSSDGSISWGSAYALSDYVVSGLEVPTIVLDSNGYPWVGGALESNYPVVYRGAKKDGTWSTGARYLLSESQAAYPVTFLVPRSGGRMTAIYYLWDNPSSPSNYVLWKTDFDGSLWGPPDNLATIPVSGYPFMPWAGAVTNFFDNLWYYYLTPDNRVHVCFENKTEVATFSLSWPFMNVPLRTGVMPMLARIENGTSSLYIKGDNLTVHSQRDTLSLDSAYYYRHTELQGVIADNGRGRLQLLLAYVRENLDAKTYSIYFYSQWLSGLDQGKGYGSLDAQMAEPILVLDNMYVALYNHLPDNYVYYQVSPDGVHWSVPWRMQGPVTDDLYNIGFWTDGENLFVADRYGFTSSQYLMRFRFSSGLWKAAGVFDDQAVISPSDNLGACDYRGSPYTALIKDSAGKLLATGVLGNSLLLFFENGENVVLTNNPSLYYPFTFSEAVRLDNGLVYFIYSDNAYVKGRTWDGQTLGPEESIFTHTTKNLYYYTAFMSASHLGNEVHLVVIDNLSYVSTPETRLFPTSVYLVRRENGQWEGPLMVFENTLPAISVNPDNGDVHFFGAKICNEATGENLLIHWVRHSDGTWENEMVRSLGPSASGYSSMMGVVSPREFGPGGTVLGLLTRGSWDIEYLFFPYVKVAAVAPSAPSPAPSPGPLPGPVPPLSPSLWVGAGGQQRTQFRLGEVVTVRVTVVDVYGTPVDGATVVAQVSLPGAASLDVQMVPLGGGVYEGTLNTSQLGEGTFLLSVSVSASGYETPPPLTAYLTVSKLLPPTRVPVEILVFFGAVLLLIALGLALRLRA
jgi:hypothetical protein